MFSKIKEVINQKSKIRVISISFSIFLVLFTIIFSLYEFNDEIFYSPIGMTETITPTSSVFPSISRTPTRTPSPEVIDDFSELREEISNLSKRLDAVEMFIENINTEKQYSNDLLLTIEPEIELIRDRMIDLENEQIVENTRFELIDKDIEYINADISRLKDERSENRTTLIIIVGSLGAAIIGPYIGSFINEAIKLKHKPNDEKKKLEDDI